MLIDDIAKHTLRQPYQRSSETQARTRLESR